MRKDVLRVWLNNHLTRRLVQVETTDLISYLSRRQEERQGDTSRDMANLN